MVTDIRNPSSSSQVDVGFPSEFRFVKILGNRGKTNSVILLNKLLILQSSGFFRIAILPNKRKQNDTISGKIGAV